MTFVQDGASGASAGISSWKSVKGPEKKKKKGKKRKKEKDLPTPTISNNFLSLYACDPRPQKFCQIKSLKMIEKIWN